VIIGSGSLCKSFTITPTDADGNFLFASLVPQIYTLTPPAGGVGFTPAQATFNLTTSLVTNFQAKPVEPADLVRKVARLLQHREA